MRKAARRRSLLDAEDVDPLAFVPNLFDAILVLTAALLVSWAAARATLDKVPEETRAIQGFSDTGVQRSGEGERLGVAYRLGDGRLVYVPE